MPSSEEEAFRRLRDEVAATPPPVPDEAKISFQVPASVVHEALTYAVRDELRHSTIIRNHLAALISDQVKELIPESAEFQSVREELQDHLRRYPALLDDPRLQEKVAMAIFGHIQGTPR